MPSWLNYWQSYSSAALLILISFLVVNFLTALILKFPQNKKTLPTIRQRDVHTVQKPRIGGLAMWFSIGIILLVLMFSGGLFGSGHALDFGGRHIWGIDSAVIGILLGMVVVLLFGFWDDLRNLSPIKQILGQVLAGVALVFSGVTVDYIRIPTGGIINFNTLTLDLPTIFGIEPVSILSAIFIIIWVVLMINVINLFDGLDGLASSISATAALVLFFVSMRVGFIGTASLSLIIVGVAGGFLIWNWYPSKIFMGSVGSQLLGFLLATVAIISGGKVATAVLVLGMPILDAIAVTIRRISAGVSPFKADQRHLHHRMLKIGIPTPWVVIILNAVSIVFGVMAIQTQEASKKGILTLAMVGCMLVFILLTYLLERRAIKRVR